MDQALTPPVHALIMRAPVTWLNEACETLRTAPAIAKADFIKKRMPTTSNAHLAFLLYEVVDAAVGKVSWEALGYSFRDPSA
jgi:hypothetical protein